MMSFQEVANLVNDFGSNSVLDTPTWIEEFSFPKNLTHTQEADTSTHYLKMQVPNNDSVSAYPLS